MYNALTRSDGVIRQNYHRMYKPVIQSMILPYLPRLRSLVEKRGASPMEMEVLPRATSTLTLSKSERQQLLIRE